MFKGNLVGQPRPALPLSSLKDSKYNNDLDIDSYESLTAFSIFNSPPPLLL